MDLSILGTITLKIKTTFQMVTIQTPRADNNNKKSQHATIVTPTKTEQRPQTLSAASSCRSDTPRTTASGVSGASFMLGVPSWEAAPDPEVTSFFC